MVQSLMSSFSVLVWSCLLCGSVLPVLWWQHSNPCSVVELLTPLLVAQDDSLVQIFKTLCTSTCSTWGRREDNSYKPQSSPVAEHTPCSSLIVPVFLTQGLPMASELRDGLKVAFVLIAVLSTGKTGKSSVSLPPVKLSETIAKVLFSVYWLFFYFSSLMDWEWGGFFLFSYVRKKKCDFKNRKYQSSRQNHEIPTCGSRTSANYC